MASSLKAWGALLALLCLQRKPLAHSKAVSRWKFMEEHQLDPSQGFGEYNCNALLKDKPAPEHEPSRLFIYISWYKAKHMCGKLNDRYRNAYVWTLTPFKVLQCHWESVKNGYAEKRSYSYVQFHCNKDGYIESVEDMNIIQPLLR